MIHVIATITLKPGTRQKFLDVYRRFVPIVLAEAGCFEYQPTVDVQSTLNRQIPLREDVVTVVEKWSSLKALDDHNRAHHMEEFRTQTGDFIISVSLLVLEPV